MPVYRDEAIVLRTHKLAEADRIISLLTHRHGLVRAVAKGVRRTSSKFGARLEPFTHVDLQLAQGRNLDVVTQAVTHASYGDRISADYARYTAASAMVEAVQKLLVEEREPAAAHFQLLVAGLRALSLSHYRPGDVLDSFLLRALAVAGYAPSFGDCAVCGAPGPHRAFHPSAGGITCADCRLPSSSQPAGATVELLGALLAGQWGIVNAATTASRREAHRLVRAYLTWHLERGLRSLQYVEVGS